VPSPDKVSAPGEFEALLKKETLPAALPAVCGVKVTEKEAVCPACTVAGKLIPPTAYPPPLHSADETVILDGPAVSDPVCVALFPTITFPKFIAAGDTTSWPAARPSPLNGTDTFELAASLVTERFPVAAPPDLGAKVTSNVMLCPGATETGNAGAELTPNPAPVTVSLEMVAISPLLDELLIVKELVLALPTATLPKINVLIPEFRLALLFD
jgi:hypothetical protein